MEKAGTTSDFRPSVGGGQEIGHLPAYLPLPARVRVIPLGVCLAGPSGRSHVAVIHVVCNLNLQDKRRGQKRTQSILASFTPKWRDCSFLITTPFSQRTSEYSAMRMPFCPEQRAPSARHQRVTGRTCSRATSADRLGFSPFRNTEHGTQGPVSCRPPLTQAGCRGR